MVFSSFKFHSVLELKTDKSNTEIIDMFFLKEVGWTEFYKGCRGCSEWFHEGRGPEWNLRNQPWQPKETLFIPPSFFILVFFIDFHLITTAWLCLM